MPNTVLAGLPFTWAADNSSQNLAGGLLFTYAAGSTTPLATFQDLAGTVANTNPVILDNNGRATVRYQAAAYKLVLTLPDGVTVLKSVDNYYPPADQTTLEQFFNGQTPLEALANITPSNLAYEAGCPERYLAAGSWSYATNTAGSGGTDFSTAINTALSITGQPCILSANYYALWNTIQMPAASSLLGAGMWATNICCVASKWTASHILTDTGNAAKIVIRNLAFYGNSVIPGTGLTTDGINIGNNTTVFGTAGFLDQIYLANVSGAALNIRTNIADMGTIYCNICAGVQILGSGTHIDNLSIVGATGIPDINTNQTACYLGDIHIADLEVEAPASGTLFLTANGATRIDAFWPSLAPNAAHTELVYVTSSAANWRVNIPTIYFSGTGSAPTLYGTYTNVVYDQASTFFSGAGSTSTATPTLAGIGDYGYSSFISGSTLAVKKQQLNAFTLRVENVSAVLKHSISAVGQAGTATNFASSFQLTVPSATLTTTPTGTDTTTPFAAGGKIGSATASFFILDTNAEVAGDACFIAVITANNSGTAYNIVATQSSINVNGATQNRVVLQLVNPTTAAGVSWATALASNGNLIDTTVFGFWR